MQWSDLKLPPINLISVMKNMAMVQKADCQNCVYKLAIGNHHCYFFKSKPGSHCSQFEKVNECKN